MLKQAVLGMWLVGVVAAATGVYAEEGTIKLPEVVVTATKTEKDPKDVTQSVTVITADEIKKSGAMHAAEAIRKTVGVTMHDQGPSGALKTVSIRGSRYAQVLVLLDGRRLNSPRDGGYDFSLLPVALEDIERIEIVRGASSALYGADAVGGVVNIITKKPSLPETHVSGAIGSRGYDAAAIGSSGKAGYVTYALSASRETSDGFRRNSDYDKKNAGGTLGYALNGESSLELTARHAGKEIGVPGPLIAPTPEARQESRETVAVLGYKTRLSPGLDLRVNTSSNRDILAYQYPFSTPPQSHHESWTNGADAQVNWLITASHLLTAGYEAKRDHLMSSDSGEHAASLAAGYLQDEITIGEPLIVILGGRYDSHSLYGDEFSPRANARYLIGSTGTIFRVSAGKSFRAPTFNDLYWPYNSSTWFGTTFITQGNPDLKPETAKEYEAGVEQPLGGTGVVKLTRFLRKSKDMIDWAESQPDPTTYQYEPRNIGRARTTGIEAETRWTVSDAVAWTVNYTYLNPVDEVNGEKIYYTVPQELLKSALVIRPASKTTVYVEYRMVENYVKPGEARWQYSVVDGKISQSVPIGNGMKGDVFFGMNNIFDRDYQVVRRYPMPPKEIYGGIAVKF